MIRFLKIKFVENVHFAHPFLNIGIKFWTHAAKGNRRDCLLEKGCSRIIVIGPMK